MKPGTGHGSIEKFEHPDFPASKKPRHHYLLPLSSFKLPEKMDWRIQTVGRTCYRDCVIHGRI